MMRIVRTLLIAAAVIGGVVGALVPALAADENTSYTIKYWTASQNRGDYIVHHFPDALH